MSEPRCRSVGRRRGAALLEAVVAMALIAIIGLVALEHARTAVRITESVEAWENSTLAAGRLLDAVTLWDRAELEQRMGVRQQGPWWLDIQRLTPDLYHVAVLDSSASVVLLETALLRVRSDAGGH